MITAMTGSREGQVGGVFCKSKNCSDGRRKTSRSRGVLTSWQSAARLASAVLSSFEFNGFRWRKKMQAVSLDG